ncbi:hypothetical protein CDAR_86021 [Caerostris darwini]|uniref:Uncharacterized protein n=1 Tax=Caerostris darwini TaxID=1538125 RepID=A0AAV4V4I8_9ARAC|nr:hypothetical protein CDAR_86021 [Caerostris darwini]
MAASLISRITTEPSSFCFETFMAERSFVMEFHMKEQLLIMRPPFSTKHTEITAPLMNIREVTGEPTNKYPSHLNYSRGAKRSSTESPQQKQAERKTNYAFSLNKLLNPGTESLTLLSILHSSKPVTRTPSYKENRKSDVGYHLNQSPFYIPYYHRSSSNIPDNNEAELILFRNLYGGKGPL